VTVFVDTSAFVAAFDRDHPRRDELLDAFEHLAASDDLVTHQYVVLETVALLQRRLGLDAVEGFVQRFLRPLEIVWVDPALHTEALAALLRSGRRGVSLVDWVSFIVMRRRSMQRALALDADFATEGFDVLPG
jgi:uncharacterized protein